MGSMMGGPMGALGVLVGSLGTPLIANGISDKHLPYWALAVGNMLVSTATVAAVSAGTYDQFKEGQEGAYNGMCFLVPIGASILTSSIMLALAGRPDKVEPVDPMIPALGMVITSKEQSVLLGWQF